MIQPLCRGDGQQRILEFRRRPDAIAALEVQLGAGQIGIAPAGLYLLPWERLPHIQQIAELVVHDALQIRIMAQDGTDVGQGVLDGAVALQIQLCLPVIVRFEILLRLRCTILCQRFLYACVLHRKVAHGLIGRQLAGRCVGGNLIVKITEPVNAHQIEGVEQLSAGRVGSMVAVSEFAVVEHHASRRIRRHIIVAACHGAGLVHVGKEGVDGFLNRVRPTESAHDAGLGKRVGLLLALSVDERALTG